MKITQHTSNNDVLRAPPGMSIEACRPAPITRARYSDEGIVTHTVTTYWRPTEDERAAIAAGALVRVEVLGQTMAPMVVGAEGVPLA